MKKFLMLFVLLFSLGLFAANTYASKYELNDAKVNALFAEATSIEFTTDFSSAPANAAFAVESAVNEKDALVAILLDVFVGGFGVHRFYLGTKTMTGIGYILTCGGIFGIVPLVDLIVLAVNFNDISPYIDNSKFFMW